MANEIKKNNKLINCDSKIVIATGFGGLGREYPDYYEKFGKENVEIIRWDKSCTDIDSHLIQLKKFLPKNEPFALCGHSLGGGLIIELMSREKIPNLQSVVLIGSSKKIKEDPGLSFMMFFPWPCLWMFAGLLVLAFPICVCIWRKKTMNTYFEMFKFLKRDGARKIHKQYNQTLKKLGQVNEVLQPEIPLLYVGLPKDALVDEKDLMDTFAMFKNTRTQYLYVDSIHLVEKYDPITVEKIAEEAEFLGIIKAKELLTH